MINSTNEYNLKISETKLFNNSFLKNEKLLLPVSRNFRGHTFLSTCLLLISRLRIEFINNIIERYSLITLNSLAIDTVYNTMSTDNKTNVNSDMPTDTKISTNTSNSDNGSTKSTDGSEANNKTFNE